MQTVTITDTNNGQVIGSIVVDDDYLAAVSITDSTGTHPILLDGHGLTFTVTKAAYTPPSITTAALPNATVGTPYTATVATTGGTAPVTVTITNLPAGLTATGATITGTPTTAGTATVTIAATDSANPAFTATANLNITVAAKPTNTTTAPPVATVPAGYRDHVTLDFGNKALPRALRVRTGNQGGTESQNIAENVILDPTLGALRLRSQAKSSGGQLYTSAYCDIGSTTVADRFPLFARFQVMARYPYAFSPWCCSWLNYKGAAAKFEIDFGEQFSDQSPGCVRFQVHSPNSYGKNLIKGNGNGEYGVTTTIPYRKPTPHPITESGSSRRNMQDYAMDDGKGPGAYPGHTGWHLIEVETVRVPVGSSGWKLGIDFYMDGRKMVSWVETLPSGRTTPPWYEPGDDAHSWDLRFDHWVGGESRARASVNGTRLFVYDGKQKDGSSPSYMAPVGEAPNATLWQADLNASYYFDVAWARVLTRA